MLKRTLFLVAISLALAGCGETGKPDITSNYDINNGGEARVTFKNKGNAAGSACERIVLTKKAGISDMSKIVLPSWIEAVKTLKEKGEKAGKTLEQIVEANRSELIKVFYLVGDDVLVSDREFCSGLVQPGDVREIKGMVTFAGGSHPVVSGSGVKPFTVVPSSTIDSRLKEKLANVGTDAMLAVEYDKIKAKATGTEYKARHILVEKEADAKDIIARLKKDPKVFEALAKSKSKDPGSKDKGGDLGWFDPRYMDMVPEFGAAVAKLEKDSFTQEPVKSQFGYHVIMLDDSRARTIPTLE
jgi:hypothetical protein